MTAILLFAGAFDASAQLSDLHFDSHKVTRISPKSFRSVDGTIQVNCTNKGQQFTMSNISGTVYKKGRAFINGYAEPITVFPGSCTVSVLGNASLCDGITLWDVLACIVFKAEDYTIDVSMTITEADGKSRVYTNTGMSVANLLNNIRGK